MLTADILIPVAADLVAIICVISFYFHRHQRRDLLLSYAALNVGVLAVTTMLATASVGAGLGLGLFGILSIIRLRSDAITQEEIAYYFVALALGLLAGLHPGAIWVAPALSALLVVVMYAVDHPRTFPGARRQMLTLDEAIPDEHVLRARIEQRLGVDVRHLIVQEIDFVRDLTVVDIRFRRPAPTAQPAPSAPGTQPVASSARTQHATAGAR